MSTRRIIIMNGYVKQAEALKPGLNLFGSRKRKKHEANINTQIDQDNADFLREVSKVRADITTKDKAYKALVVKKLALIRERSQLKALQNRVIHILN